LRPATDPQRVAAAHHPPVRARQSVWPCDGDCFSLVQSVLWTVAPPAGRRRGATGCDDGRQWLDAGLAEASTMSAANSSERMVNVHTHKEGDVMTGTVQTIRADKGF